MSLDGVMQAPGSPEEDTSGNFKYGGWTAPYSLGNTMIEQMSMPFDLLLGRKTYDIFASYWPNQKSGNIATLFNKAKKYVVSDSDVDLTWDKSILIKDDVVMKLKALKDEIGPMLQVYGSSVLIQTLLKNDLVDELWLKIFPVTLGRGKHLFAKGTIPAAFKLTESKISPSGVIVANYKRAGDIKTGTIA